MIRRLIFVASVFSSAFRELAMAPVSCHPLPERGFSLTSPWTSILETNKFCVEWRLSRQNRFINMGNSTLQVN